MHVSKPWGLIFRRELALPAVSRDEREHSDIYLLLGATCVLVFWAEPFFFPWKIQWSDMIGISRAHAWICLLFCCCQRNKNRIRILNHCGNTFETCWLRSRSPKHCLAFFSRCLHAIVSHSACLSIIHLSSHSNFLVKQQTKLDFSSPKTPTYKI